MAELNSSDTGPDASPLEMSLSEKTPKLDLCDSKSSSFAMAPNADQQYKEIFPRNATDEEIQNLPHIRGEISMITWILLLSCASTNFARYGITAIFQNYIQNPRGNPLVPGALSLGQAKATTIQSAFLLYCYITPLPFSIISDTWLGRYCTMMVSMGLLTIGYLVIVLTSIPLALDGGAGLGGLIAAMILIGLGQGGMTAVMVVFIGDQVPDSKPIVVRVKNKMVVVSYKATIQFVFNALYWVGNIAALAELPTTLMEKHIDFWPAFLMPTCVMTLCIAPLLIWNKSLVKLPPQGNVLTHTFHVLRIACRSRFHLSAADPSINAQNQNVPWTSNFVNEIRRGLTACRVMIGFTIFWLCYNQAGNNFVSQASQMKTGGVSNDTLQTFNPVAVIIVVPIIQYIQNALRHRKITFGPILRMAGAFLFTGVALAYAAGLQHLIYSRGPCFSHPLACPAALGSDSDFLDARQPNEVSVWLQIPLYILLAIGETFGLVALYEYSFSEAPVNLKSLVQAIGQLTVALAAALGAALGPVSKDPFLVIFYGCLAGIIGVGAVLFWALFRRYDKEFERQESLSSKNGSTD